MEEVLDPEQPLKPETLLDKIEAQESQKEASLAHKQDNLNAHRFPIDPNVSFVLKVVEPFDWKKLIVNRIGDIKYWQKGSSLRICQRNCTSVLLIDLEDVMYLSANPAHLREILKRIGRNKRTVLSKFIQDVITPEGILRSGNYSVEELKKILKQQPKKPREQMDIRVNDLNQLDKAPLLKVVKTDDTLLCTPVTFREAEPFPLKKAVREIIGNSIVFRILNNETLAIMMKGATEIVFVHDEILKTLSSLNKVDFYSVTESIGIVKQDILWAYLENLKDDAMGCFRAVRANTKTDGKIGISDSDQDDLGED